MSRLLRISAAVVGLMIAAAGPAGAVEPFPPFTQPVVDVANIVPSETERTVGAELIAYQARSGNQIAVAVLDTTGGRSIEDYAIDLGRAWGVGQKDKDSGVLLVIANRDRKLRIEVGRGLEGKLTDLQSGRIIRERLVPLLTQGDVAAAVVQGTQAIRAQLGDTQVGQLPPALGARQPGRSTAGWLFLLPLLGFAAVAVIRRARPGGRRSGRGGDRGGGRGGHGDAIVWGAALAALGGVGGHGGGGGFGGGGGGGFGGGGASGGW